MGSWLKVPVSRGLTTLVDECDAEIALSRRWSASPRSRADGFYVCASGRKGDPSTVYLHRLIMSPEPGMAVDHINGDTLDNRRSNLRLATPQQNAANRRTRGNKTGYRGVMADKGIFRANIRLDGRTQTFGRYTTAREAALRYDLIASRAFGEFAVLNFPVQS